MNNHRRTSAWNKRNEANQLANQREHPKHISNGDEHKFRHKAHTAECHSDPKAIDKSSYLMSFTKGLPHNIETGLIKNPDHFQFLVKGIDSGDSRDFRDTPLGNEENIGHPDTCKIPKEGWRSEKAKTSNNGGNVDVRAWESQSAGLAFELEGPDAQAVTMPPAPSLGSAELTAEMAEVYIQALLRDVPFNAMSAGVNKAKTLTKVRANNADVAKVKQFTDKLNKLEWFNSKSYELNLNSSESARHRGFEQTPSSAFRGITEGDNVGPYISQFLLIGNTGINGKDKEREASDGFVSYGAISVEQKVRVAKEKIDYMTKWEEWFDVQNGADLRGLEDYNKKPNKLRRFIYTPRDLATYVHYDALYEAYLNACLILLGKGMPFDPGIPFQESDNRDHQQGFAHFGGPHILSLVTEVATRALKAVRFQKYNVHRRCRPEVLAARLTKIHDLAEMAPELAVMESQLNQVHRKGDIGILASIEKHNKNQNKKKKKKKNHVVLAHNYLLPMAFCEGSPMHPAYGAGHATVAGACITILKAFFDHKRLFKANGEDASQAYVSTNNGDALELIPVFDKDCNPAHLTVEGELNKLASNISIGRNWAGVHYFTDYYESLLMGEEIAIGILEEQKLMFGEVFSMTVPLFNGDSFRI